jgi:glycosyltransferase involved in cell wall biosynthesis
MLDAVIVSYAFPPVGGAGVARMLKLAKYLPVHGVRPRVLTVENPSVPVIDKSLERDVAPDLEVLRARTLEPGYGVKRAAWQSKEAAKKPGPMRRAVGAAGWLARQLLVPDPQILWQPGAQRALARTLWRKGADVVLVSGPPFSQFLLAPLARARGAAVVLDYRDEWSTYRTTYEMMGRAQAAAGAAMEAALLRAADAVTTATDAFRERLLESFRFLDPARVHAIPNGWDAEDFPAQLPSPPRERYVLTHAGTVFRLTSPRGLLGAVRRLHAEHPELGRLLDVRFIGRIVETELGAFEGTEALGVRRIDYIPHDEVIPALAASHRVLCLLDEVAGVERIYPAKIFEIMRLGRPCLTLAPPGALTELVLRHRVGDVLPPRDEAAIAALLERELRAFASGTPPPAPETVGIERYDRRALAGEFADVMRSAIATR